MKSKYFWIKEGVTFGVFILIISIILDYFRGELTQVLFLIKLIIYPIEGLAYGIVMRYLRKNPSV